MKVSALITKLIVSFSKRGIEDWDIPVEKQHTILNSLKEPNDLFDRSYNQYCCQKVFFKKGDMFLMQTASFIALPFFVLIALFCKRKFLKNVDAIGNFNELPEVIPQSLLQKYDINLDLWTYKFSLTFSDLRFLGKLWLRHPFSPYFLLKCVMNVSRFSHMISLYQPKALIEHAEFSFTSSVQTSYCRERGVKHIDVMHGEKWFSLKDTFFEYDSCYVWDEYYISLFKSLRCSTSQFIVEVPPSLQIETEKHKNVSTYADFKYYLWEDKDESLSSIVKSLEPIKAKGYTLKYRPHPRWCKNENLLKYIPANEIEDPHTVDILTSLSNVKYVVGFGTTVLYQAYMSHINTIMDDVTYHDMYFESKNRKYLLAEKDLPRLSNIFVDDDKTNS